LTSLLGATWSFFLVSPLIRSARATWLAALSSIICRSLSLADESRSSQTALERLPLSLQELLKLALESLKLVESSPEFLCVVICSARRCVVVVVTAVIAAATRATSSIITLPILIIARIAPPIIFIVAMPLNHAKPPVRHIRGLVLMVSPAECVLCETEQHFLEISITDSRTDDLSHYFFRSLDIVISYRIPTSSATRRCVADACDCHFVRVYELE